MRTDRVAVLEAEVDRLSGQLAKGLTERDEWRVAAESTLELIDGHTRRLKSALAASTSCPVSDPVIPPSRRLTAGEASL